MAPASTLGCFHHRHRPNSLSPGTRTTRFKSVGLVWMCPQRQWGASSACLVMGHQKNTEAGKATRTTLCLCSEVSPILVGSKASCQAWCQDIVPSLSSCWAGCHLSSWTGRCRAAAQHGSKVQGDRNCAPGVPACLPSPETAEGRTDPLVLGQDNAQKNILVVE